MDLERKINLGERIKEYENIYNAKIPKNHYIIVRLDGKNFSNFTRGFKSPFDINFIKAMNLTQMDILNKFQATTTYSHSDEITVIFNKMDEENQTQFYGGRVQKIITLLSSYCSIRFNFHLCKIFEQYKNTDEYTQKFMNLINNCEQIFDARIISTENKYEITNHQIWRSVHDCERNAISSYGHSFYHHKMLHGKNCSEIIEMLKIRNIDWNNIPIYIKHGVYAKKILYDTECYNLKTNKKDICKRTKIIMKTFKIKFGEEITDLLLEKYWNDEIFTIDNEHELI
jgi:tRNA(His) guanylyltransferase